MGVKPEQRVPSSDPTRQVRLRNEKQAGLQSLRKGLPWDLGQGSGASLCAEGLDSATEDSGSTGQTVPPLHTSGLSFHICAMWWLQEALLASWVVTERPVGMMSQVPKRDVSPRWPQMSSLQVTFGDSGCLQWGWAPSHLFLTPSQEEPSCGWAGLAGSGSPHPPLPPHSAHVAGWQPVASDRPTGVSLLNDHNLGIWSSACLSLSVADSHAAVSACLRPVHPCCSRLVPALPSPSSVCCSVGHLSGGPAARHWSDRSSDSLIGDSGWVWILTPGLCLLSQTLICHPHAEPSCHPQKPIRLPPTTRNGFLRKKPKQKVTPALVLRWDQGAFSAQEGLFPACCI